MWVLKNENLGGFPFFLRGKKIETQEVNFFHIQLLPEKKICGESLGKWKFYINFQTKDVSQHFITSSLLWNTEGKILKTVASKKLWSLFLSEMHFPAKTKTKQNKS